MRTPSVIAAIDAVERMPSGPVRRLAASSLSPGCDWFTKVSAFHSVYGMPIAPRLTEDNNLTHMTRERLKMRLDLILEEVLETVEASGFDVVVDVNDMFLTHDNPRLTKTRTLGCASQPGFNADTVEVADGLGDIIYVVVGMALEAGIDLDRVISEIHASNLTKLGPDGLPILRNDGKVMKGPDYVRPDVALALGFKDS